MSFSAQTQSETSGERETQSLIAASLVKGTSVYNAEGESLGSIYDVMIEKQSGKVAYAILSFGGFLGLGEKYHPLPWAQLTYSEAHSGYLINLSKNVLEAAPAYAATDNPDWASAGYRGTIDKYYQTRTVL